MMGELTRVSFFKFQVSCHPSIRPSIHPSFLLSFLPTYLFLLWCSIQCWHLSLDSQAFIKIMSEYSILRNARVSFIVYNLDHCRIGEKEHLPWGYHKRLVRFFFSSFPKKYVLIEYGSDQFDHRKTLQRPQVCPSYLILIILEKVSFWASSLILFFLAIEFTQNCARFHLLVMEWSTSLTNWYFSLLRTSTNILTYNRNKRKRKRKISYKNTASFFPSILFSLPLPLPPFLHVSFHSLSLLSIAQIYLHFRLLTY